MADTRDYSSIYSIKDFTIKEIAPKYFPMDDISTLNVGLFGYVTDLISGISEDLFNTVSTYSQEIFPNKAQLPENIYSYAAFYEIDDLFSTAAEMQTYLIIKEEDIINYGVPTNDKYRFVIDSALRIEVEGIPFLCDYDIIINCKPHKGDYIITAQYDIQYDNSLSKITNPYIKTKRIIYGGKKHVALSIWVRQCEREIIETTIITNDKINLPSVTFNYSGKLSSFEAFYRASQNDNWVQLKKRLIGSNPLREPFCFYTIKSDTEIELTFSPKESYFQPAFNSEIKVITTTTKGEEGVFPYYRGTNISVIPYSETHTYNNNLILFAIPQSDSIGGTTGPSIDELRDIVHERRSTLETYTTENDLQLYFSNLKHRYGTDILFIKKRDDIFERVFSSFVLLKDAYGDFYNTNTTDMYLYPDQFDSMIDQSNRHILKAGALFKYVDNKSYIIEKTNGNLSDTNLAEREEEYLYTNPFLMMISGNVVGFYLNSAQQNHALEYSYVNTDSITQFISSNIEISRNATLGDTYYTLSLYLSPTSELIQEIVTVDGTYMGTLKVCGVLYEASAESALVHFDFVDYDNVTNSYRFDAIIETDDYITLNNKVRLKNLISIDDGTTKDFLIQMFDSPLSIYAFYKYPEDEDNTAHHLEHIEEYKGYTITNKYTTSEDFHVNFITPLKLMRSTLTYEPETNPDKNSPYRMKLTYIPVIDARTINKREVFKHFVETLFIHNNQLESILDKVLNNHGIDMKFYNTYGRSKNFTVGEQDMVLDKVNCSIHFKILPHLGADEELEFSIRLFIKEYIEKINSDGTNAIYISNLIQQLHNNFKDIKYLKFIRINKYPSAVQVIESKTVDINLLEGIYKKQYVPEYLTLREEDIKIEIIEE